MTTKPLYFGREIESLTREELIEAVYMLGEMSLKALRRERQWLDTGATPPGLHIRPNATESQQSENEKPV